MPSPENAPRAAHLAAAHDARRRDGARRLRSRSTDERQPRARARARTAPAASSRGASAVAAREPRGCVWMTTRAVAPVSRALT